MPQERPGLNGPFMGQWEAEAIGCHPWDPSLPSVGPPLPSSFHCLPRAGKYRHAAPSASAWATPPWAAGQPPATPLLPGTPTLPIPYQMVPNASLSGSSQGEKQHSFPLPKALSSLGGHLSRGGHCLASRCFTLRLRHGASEDFTVQQQTTSSETLTGTDTHQALKMCPAF